MKYTIGSLVIVAGILIIMKTEWILENFGSIPWAEQHLGTEGGSRIMYKFIGLAAIILSVMAMTGLLGEIILNVFGPFFGIRQ